MKQKKITLGFDARDKVLEGVNFIADAVQSTLGPFGQNFLLEKGNKVTNDGKIIGAEQEHEDETANRALVIARKASIDTEQEVQDASTTSLVLTRAILIEAVKFLPTRDVKIGKLTTGDIAKKIQKERAFVDDQLDSMKEEIDSLEKLTEVTTVSTEDADLAKIIAEAQWELGMDGILIAEETIDTECSYERVNGILIDNGISSSGMINNEEKQSLEMKDTPVLLTNHTVDDLATLGPIIEKLHKAGKSRLTIVARAFTEKAIKGCFDYIKAGFVISAVNAPYVDQAEVFKDLQAILGGKFIHTEQGSLVDLELADIGFAEAISAERYRSIFAGTKSEESEARIEARVAELKEKLTGTISVFDRKNIESRLAQLTKGFGIVKIGSHSETERKRLKDKADDAVGTVRNALKGGVVAGGGKAFKAISEKMEDDSILKRPLAVIYEHIMSTAPKGFVIEDWVKDPVITLKVALKHASLTAGDLATVYGVSTTKRDPVRYVQEVNQTNE